MAGPKSLETNVLFLTGELTHVLHRALTIAFRKNKIDVTVEQFAILALLFYRDGINQQEMSVQLNRSKTTITRVIAIMERDELIVRATDKNDSRGKLIFLTAQGKAIQRKAISISGGLYLKAVAGVKTSSLKETALILNQIIRNLK